MATSSSFLPSSPVINYGQDLPEVLRRVKERSKKLAMARFCTLICVPAIPVQRALLRLSAGNNVGRRHIVWCDRLERIQTK